MSKQPGTPPTDGLVRVGRAFASMRSGSCARLIPFVTAGYPDLETTTAILRGLDSQGIGLCEIGVPFSDPIADGPVIASSMHDAIEGGFTLRAMLDALGDVRGKVSMALVAMSSVTLAQRRGIDGFVTACGASGFDGVLFPDLPVEESSAAQRATAEAGLACPMLIAPTTPDARAEQIARATTGFVYLLARTGITGVRDDAPEIGQRVAQLRALTATPIACGFGIGSAAAVRTVTEHADAAIVGSAIVGVMQSCVCDGLGRDAIVDAVCRFVGDLVA
jgi:tryptophan synthase alpha chain